MDYSNLLENLIDLLKKHNIRFCVIGGQAVNAYAEPLVSLDLDLVVAVDQVDKVETLFEKHFTVKRFPHSLNVSAEGADLRVRIHADPRYSEFVERSSVRDVLGMSLPVARIEDVLRGKVWAAVDPQRRPSKRRKDLLDIEGIMKLTTNIMAPTIPMINPIRPITCEAASPKICSPILLQPNVRCLTNPQLMKASMAPTAIKGKESTNNDACSVRRVLFSCIGHASNKCRTDTLVR